MWSSVCWALHVNYGWWNCTYFSGRQNYSSATLVLLRLGLAEGPWGMFKTFITDRGRPYTNTPVLHESPHWDEPIFCMACKWTIRNVVRYIICGVFCLTSYINICQHWGVDATNILWFITWSKHIETHSHFFQWRYHLWTINPDQLTSFWQQK